MEIGVREASQRLGVSDRRVRELINAGRIPARLIGGRYLVNEVDLVRAPAVSRPMSARIAWAFIALLSGDPPDGVSASELVRLRKKLAHLDVEPDPALLLRSWLARRCPARSYSAAPEDLAEIGQDERVVASGISDQRSGLSSAGEFEGYLAEDDVDGVAADYLLSGIGKPNVVLHVHGLAHDMPAPIGVVLADLADRRSAREDGKVRELLRSQVSTGVRR